METKYVVVYTGYGALDAEMVRVFLQSNGIEGYISQESYGATLGLTVGPLGEARVLVPAQDAEEALKLIEAMEAGELVEGADATGENEEDEEASEQE